MRRRVVRSSQSAGRRRSPATTRSSRLPRVAGGLLLPLAAALVPLVVYWRTTAYGFVLDDTVLFRKSSSLADLGSIPKGFLTDLGALRKGTDTVISSFYRPVFLAPRLGAVRSTCRQPLSARRKQDGA
jgi:hypothetical protein